jgi:glycosyltransferase involved in cell wall biosynthesis
MARAARDAGTGTGAGGERPLVTCVVPTHSRPEGLVRAVESVLAQTHRPLELVVVDDNPTERAVDLLSHLDTDTLDRVVYRREGGHSGAGAARNTGVEAARGEFVAFLDDDDAWRPEKVARQVAALEADPDAGLCYTGTVEIRPDGRREHVPPDVADADLTDELACRNVVGSMSVVCVRTALAREHPFDAAMPAWEDLDWFLRLSRVTRFARLPEPLVEYDFTSADRLSESFDRTDESHRRFVEKHAPEFSGLAARRLRGWAAFRAGTDAFATGHYPEARRYFLRAVLAYPLESRFYPYVLAAAGGTTTHRLARRVQSLGI